MTMSGVVPGGGRARSQVLALSIGVALLVASLPASAQTAAGGARLQLPNLDALAKRAINVTDVTLDPALLKLAAGFLSDDPEEESVKQLISKLEGIYVKSFDFGAPGAYAPSDIDAVRKQLTGPNWTRIVGIQSSREGNQTDVYVWMEKNQPRGLAVLELAPQRLTIVNIVGAIDLAELKSLGGQLGVPRLDLDKPKKE